MADALLSFDCVDDGLSISKDFSFVTQSGSIGITSIFKLADSFTDCFLFYIASAAGNLTQLQWIET